MIKMCAGLRLIILDRNPVSLLCCVYFYVHMMNFVVLWGGGGVVFRQFFREVTL
jgi:hypothetical protein